MADYVYKIATNIGGYIYTTYMNEAMVAYGNGYRVYRAIAPDEPCRPYDLDYVEVKVTFVDV